MELLDVVDENNEITGQVAKREREHKENLWHRHVSAWIMNEKGEILLQKRAQTTANNANKWAKTGGHVDSGETVENAIVREIKEEIGIDVPEEQIKVISKFKSKNPENKYFSYGFLFVVNYKIEDYKLNEDEVSEVKYMTIEDMEKAKRENDSSYTFQSWNDDEFFEEMSYMKQKRKEVIGNATKTQ